MLSFGLLLSPILNHQVAIILVYLQVLQDIAGILRLLYLLCLQSLVDGPYLSLLRDNALPHSNDESFALVVNEIVLYSF